MIELTNSAVFFYIFQKAFDLHQSSLKQHRRSWMLESQGNDETWTKKTVGDPFIFSEIELGGPKEATSTHTHTV